MGHPDRYGIDSQCNRIGVCMLREANIGVAIVSPCGEGADQDNNLLGDEILRSIPAVSWLPCALRALKQEFYSQRRHHRILRHHDRAHKKCGERRRFLGGSVAGVKKGTADGRNLTDGAFA